MSGINSLIPVVADGLRIEVTPGRLTPVVGPIGRTTIAGVVLIDQGCTYRESFRNVVIVGLARTSKQRKVQDLKEVVLLVRSPETINTSMRIGVPVLVRQYPSIANVPPLTSRVLPTYYVSFYPKEAK
jgi:hypothetical protein